MEWRVDKKRINRGMSLLEIAALSSVGLVRKFNEDALLIGTDIISEEEFGPKRFVLPIRMTALIVADGMGGHRNGALASKTALSTIREMFPQGAESWRWENVIHFANDAIYDTMDRSPSSRGMGTTIAGVATGEDQIVYFNVGDSRVYRHSGGELIKLSHDDVPLGTGSNENRLSHQITQSLGGRTTKTPVRPHVGTSPALGAGDTLLICSDGLTDMIPEQHVSTAIGDENDLERCVRRLLELALNGGGQDNISIVVARILR